LELLFAGEEDTCVRASDNQCRTKERREDKEIWELQRACLLAFAGLSTDEKRREERKMKSEEKNEEEKRGGHDSFLIARHSFCHPPFVTILHVRLIVSHAQAYD
jgi:hypothetical protein